MRYEAPAITNVSEVGDPLIPLCQIGSCPEQTG